MQSSLLTFINLRTTTIVLLTFLLSACASNLSKEDWPSDMPPRQIFVDAYKTQYAAGKITNSLDNHLMWITRFYQGSILYPIGWNEMSNSLLGSIDTPERRDAMRARLRQLGITICIEWAQSNENRKIDSSAVAAWGSSLRTAAEQEEQEFFISQVEDDVAALLSGDLDTEKITRERYYPAEDYDNF
jgi:hypothetical protein